MSTPTSTVVHDPVTPPTESFTTNDALAWYLGFTRPSAMLADGEPREQEPGRVEELRDYLLEDA